jgi:hypothetical protein
MGSLINRKTIVVSVICNHLIEFNDFHLKNKILNYLQTYHTNLDFISSATKLGNLYDFLCASNLVKWTGTKSLTCIIHLIQSIYVSWMTCFMKWVLCFLWDISTMDYSHIGLTARLEAHKKSYKFPSFVADEMKSKFVWYVCK